MTHTYDWTALTDSTRLEKARSTTPDMLRESMDRLAEVGPEAGAGRMALPQPGKDRAAVVTGASSGIGEEFAEILARRGYQVVLVARSVDRLQELAGQLGPQTHPLPADLSDRTDRAALLDRVAALGLMPDILINNAGLSTLGPSRSRFPSRNSTSSKSMLPRLLISAAGCCRAWSSAIAVRC